MWITEIVLIVTKKLPSSLQHRGLTDSSKILTATNTEGEVHSGSVCLAEVRPWIQSPGQGGKNTKVGQDVGLQLPYAIKAHWSNVTVSYKIETTFWPSDYTQKYLPIRKKTHDYKYLSIQIFTATNVPKLETTFGSSASKQTRQMCVDLYNEPLAKYKHTYMHTNNTYNRTQFKWICKPFC